MDYMVRTDRRALILVAASHPWGLLVVAFDAKDG